MDNKDSNKENIRDPQVFDNKKIWRLSQVTDSLQSVVKKAYSTKYWIVASIARLGYIKSTGHCYPELIEKSDGIITASMRGFVSASRFKTISYKFKKETGEELKDGIEWLFLAEISFTPTRGITLVIVDSEPAYTVGRLAVERIKTIERLKKEGLFEKNKRLPFPMPPSRIAVISVESSNGYQDFLNILKREGKDYRISTKLFPAIMTGEKNIESIVFRLGHIKEIADRFDLVIILRGGGGEAGLAGYDSYELSAAIADFPIPVITGIGHAPNQLVATMVSHLDGITPSDVAFKIVNWFKVENQKLIDRIARIAQLSMFKLQREDARLNRIVDSLPGMVHRRVSMEEIRVNTMRHLLVSAGKLRLERESAKLDQLSLIYIESIKRRFAEEDQRIDKLQRELELINPLRMMEKGWSYMIMDGEIVKSPDQVKEGDIVTTRTSAGEIKSVVVKR
ncbi:MAG: exodeoxyribonuclease VII large subunit [Sphingobacteriia bacterium]|nr:exodeoxyribonuclease VII large subunit [Sphingobacteriia bacterium]